MRQGDRQNCGHVTVHVLARAPYKGESLPSSERDLALRHLHVGFTDLCHHVLDCAVQRMGVRKTFEEALNRSPDPVAAHLARVGTEHTRMPSYGHFMSPYQRSRLRRCRNRCSRDQHDLAGQACSSEGCWAGWTDQSGASSLPESSSRSASVAVAWTLPDAWWTGA